VTLQIQADDVDIRQFRADVAAWFAANTPKDWRATIQGLSHAGWVSFMRDWLQLLNTRGFAAAHVPQHWGGGGYSPIEHAIILEEWARHDGPALDLFEIGLHHVPSTFAVAGTPEQQERYIKAAIAGTIWCQGFSEPDAGSDLAGLRTRAIADGDEFVVTGQKIWSSHADDAELCLLLARTDPDAPQHKGITYFVLDLGLPGVEVRPIRQGNGHSEFCEIFLDNVRIPADSTIGAVNDGWAVAQATLQAERGVLGLDLIERMGFELPRAAEAIERRLPPEPGDGPLTSTRQTLAEFRARHAAVRSLASDSVALMQRAASAGSLSSLMKVSFTELLKEMMGWLSDEVADDPAVDPGQLYWEGFVSGDWRVDALSSYGWTIAGGTNEIQLNIIAERLLGLPRERKA
jgi:alkylation response protein AidB-like acyl-CoA dehydrogenase